MNLPCVPVAQSGMWKSRETMYLNGAGGLDILLIVRGGNGEFANGGFLVLT